MNLKLYFRQAWELIRQNRLFSGLYMAGTALAIAMTTTMAVIYYVKLAPVYPEVNRLHTSKMVSASFTSSNGICSWAFSHSFVEEMRKMKHKDLISARYMQNGNDQNYVQLGDGRKQQLAIVSYVDREFFSLFPLRFTQGKCFSKEEFEGGLHQAVLSDNFARLIFGNEEQVVGRHFKLNYVDYQVCGVVREGSYLLGDGFSQIYIPYTVNSDYKSETILMDNGPKYIGPFFIYFLTHNQSQADSLRTEVAEFTDRINAIDPEGWQLKLNDQPWDVSRRTISKLMGEWPDSQWVIVRYLGLMFLILLLVPALNMSAMISGRMEARLAEMGVRKAFGASRLTLLSQVLWENLVLTLAGGVLGLVLSWLMIYSFRDWVFTLMDNWAGEIPEGVEVAVTGEMMFAAPIFLATLLFCVVLNLLSAMLPAWMALRKPIVYSLLQKR